MVWEGMLINGNLRDSIENFETLYADDSIAVSVMDDRNLGMRMYLILFLARGVQICFTGSDLIRFLDVMEELGRAEAIENLRKILKASKLKPIQA